MTYNKEEVRKTKVIPTRLSIDQEYCITDKKSLKRSYLFLLTHPPQND